MGFAAGALVRAVRRTGGCGFSFASSAVTRASKFAILAACDSGMGFGGSAAKVAVQRSAARAQRILVFISIVKSRNADVGRQ